MGTSSFVYQLVLGDQDLLLASEIRSGRLDVNYSDTQGTTILSLACSFGKPRVVKMLLSFPGVDVNRPGKLGLTPLHSAVLIGNLECVCLLLEAGADKSLVGGMDKMNAISFAKQCGFYEIVDLLRSFDRASLP